MGVSRKRQPPTNVVVDRRARLPKIARAAAFGLGQAALRDGLFAQALDALTTFIETFPQDERIAQAHYLRGDAELGLSRWNDAISDFQTYLSLRPGLIDSYALGADRRRAACARSNRQARLPATTRRLPIPGAGWRCASGWRRSDAATGHGR